MDATVDSYQLNFDVLFYFVVVPVEEKLV